MHIGTSSELKQLANRARQLRHGRAVQKAIDRSSRWQFDA